MIKAVFFDFYGTLVKWTPDAEKIQRDAAADEGLDVAALAIRLAYRTADAYMNEENARSPISARSSPERDRFFTEYERRLLAAAGYEVPPAQARRIWERVRSTPKELALYEDVLPTLRQLRGTGQLREPGLVLGVISNMGSELETFVAHLGLVDYVEVWVSSAEAGVTKPHAAIFQAGLRKAGVRPREALFVGDSYESDILGARNAGMHGLLLLRSADATPPGDGPNVRTLADVPAHVARVSSGRNR